jgi:two-component system, sensor histidine kinase and response regulator
LETPGIGLAPLPDQELACFHPLSFGFSAQEWSLACPNSSEELCLAFPTRTPIIAMTADAMAGDAEKFLAAGMDAYVSKPIRSGILRAEIDRLTQTKIIQEDIIMNKADHSSEAASVNLNELLGRVDNDRGLLCELLSIFKQEFPGYLQALQNAVARNDAAQVAGISHTLKGMLSSLAVTKAVAAITRLEQVARAEEMSSLRDALGTFEKEVQGLIPEMDSYLAEARP